MKNVVVLPTFNEKENIALIIPEIFRKAPDVFILVVDDNSPDGTAEIVEGLKKKYSRLSLLRRQNKKGLGEAYIHAFSELLKDSSVKRIIMMDADLSHSPDYLPEMIQQSEKYDLVVGSRYVNGGGTIGWELWRKILSRGGNTYCRLVTGIPISDCTGGFNVINVDLLRRIDFSNIDISGYAFIIELKYRIWKIGATIKEIPILFKNRIGGESKLSGHIISEGVLAPWKMIFKKNYQRTPKCLICRSNTKFLTEKHSYNLYACGDCRSIFVWPLADDYSKLYSNDYFSGATKGYGYVNYDQDKSVMSEIFEKYLDKIERALPTKGKLLDVGAATGYFLELAKKRGWDVAGVEISDYAAEIGRRKGLNIKTEAMEKVDFPPAYFDALTLWDIIEHVPNPQEILAICRRLLRTGGIIAINTPDAGSFVSRILGKHWPLLVPPEHLIIFSQKALVKLLSDQDFEIFLIKKIAKKFTLRYIFQILSSGSKFFLWEWLAKLTQNNFLGKIAIPLKLRDNVFILAIKS